MSSASQFRRAQSPACWSCPGSKRPPCAAAARLRHRSTRRHPIAPTRRPCSACRRRGCCLYDQRHTVEISALRRRHRIQSVGILQKVDVPRHHGVQRRIERVAQELIATGQLAARDKARFDRAADVLHRRLFGLKRQRGAPMAPQPATALHAEMRVSADRRRVSERRSSAMVDSLGEEVWGDASCAVALARPCPFKHRRSPKLSLQLFDGRAYFSAEPEGGVGRWIASQLCQRRTAGPAGDRTQSAT